MATTYACACIGPQNGQPRCPCMMRNVTIENGRYVERRDLGPVRENGTGLRERLRLLLEELDRPARIG